MSRCSMRPRTRPAGRACTALAAIAFAATVLVAVALPALCDPAASPSPVPAPQLSAQQSFEIQRWQIFLSGGVWITAIVALIAGAVSFFRSRTGTAAKPADGDNERARIVYGFWLIVAGLLLTLAVVTITINLFRPQNVGTADVLAIVSTVTGIVGTLTASFFGVQAAGAAPAQAIRALSQMRQGAGDGGGFTIDPPFGPHVGNTRVSVTGNGFAGSTALNFGSTPGTNFELVNDGLVRCTSPAADPAGRSDAELMVVFPVAGTTNVRVGTFFYYTLEPARGPRDETMRVTITGTGLAGAVSVTFGDGAAQRPEADGPSLVVTAPAANAAGYVPVTVAFAADSSTNTSVIGTYEYL